MTLPLLIDLYGQVLSDRKRELLDYYYNEDYSLAEIAEITGITRQGIRESMKKSEAELRSLDTSLHLAQRTRLLDEKITILRKDLSEVLESPLEQEVRQKLEKVRQALDALSF